MISHLLQSSSKDTSFYLFLAYILIGVIIFSYIFSLFLKARDKKKE